MGKSSAVLAAVSTFLLTVSAVPIAQAVDLKMWVSGGCDDSNCITRALVDGFEAANPDIKIEIVPQPTDSYFTSLLAASLTGTGPDIGTMWPGGYMTPFKQYMTDIHAYVPTDLIKESIGTAYFSEGNNNDNVVYGSPSDNQWYTGFYNKELFAKAGITALPTTWTELNDACEKLKANGILPILQGPDNTSAQFHPIFEFSYLATALPVEDWNKLYNGKLKYDNPVLLGQVEKWASLYKNGCMNEDAFNHQNTQADFTSGKGAMWFSGGSWKLPDLTEAMGDNVGVILPPFTDTPLKATISTAGSAYVVLTYSQHKEEAGKFLAYVLGDAGQQIIANLTAPTRPGFPSKLSTINDLVALSTDPSRQNYPMFDNFTQPSVTDAMYRNLALAAVGQMSAKDALDAVDAAFDALPDDQKNIEIGLTSSK